MKTSKTYNRYKFEVRSTGRPFGAERVCPDDYVVTHSRHTTLNAAEREKKRLIAEMRYSCGQNACSEHYYVFPLLDVNMVAKRCCFICGKLQTLDYVWPANEFDPDPDLPDRCSAECDREYEYKFDVGDL